MRDSNFFNRDNVNINDLDFSEENKKKVMDFIEKYGYKMKDEINETLEKSLDNNTRMLARKFIKNKYSMYERLSKL